MIRVELPAHLRTLAHVGGEVEVDVAGPATLRSVLDALEARYPVLRGTIRDHVTHKRRPYVRFFACAEDLSHELPDTPLPDAVATGVEPFLVVGRDGRRLTASEVVQTFRSARHGRPDGLHYNCLLTAPVVLLDTSPSARWGASCPRQGTTPTQPVRTPASNLLPA